ncbi:AraC family transcriptional regulator [Streptomyces chitinivorans]|uniref:AraC family transcriptional regulator n=1 Tax=Streptomyces chitinivorans TaxID=1257027 RepID=A0ABW7HLD8_9ACTN|nr:AraC family transcriptional regulator [Streptomyces chitinivorans]MDH2408025.1 AraC family transcriptional regulator [Streptomyces chitinivorans]
MVAGTDVLSELLRPLRLHGIFYSKWIAGGRWGVRGADDSCAVLHYMLRNGCVISFGDGAEPLRLGTGDLAVFPHGTAHTFADSEGRGRSALPLKSLLPDTSPGSSLCVTVGSEEPDTEILCASLHYDPAGEPSLYRALPRVIVLRRDMLEGELLLRRTLESLTTEMERTAPGARLVTLRAFEMIFVLALRTALERLSETSPALQALRHPGIGRALLAIYAGYHKPWTVESLSREAGMSRSAFAQTFRRLVGEPPARHLAARRMQEARLLLADPTVAQADIPERVGYRSAVGFHIAFRKEFGVTPGEYRASRQAAAPTPEADHPPPDASARR